MEYLTFLNHPMRFYEQKKIMRARKLDLQGESDSQEWYKMQLNI